MTVVCGRGVATQKGQVGPRCPLSPLHGDFEQTVSQGGLEYAGQMALEVLLKISAPFQIELEVQGPRGHRCQVCKACRSFPRKEAGMALDPCLAGSASHKAVSCSLRDRPWLGERVYSPGALRSVPCA